MVKKTKTSHARPSPMIFWPQKRLCGLLPLLLSCLFFLTSRGAQAAPIDSNDLEFVSIPPTNAFVANNGTNIVVHCASLESHIANTKTLLFLRYSSSGTLNESTGVTNARLFHDANEDCAFDGGDTQLSTTQVFGADNGTVSFSSVGLNIPGGAASKQNVILVYNLTGAAAANLTFTARLDTATASDVQAEIFGGGATDILGAFPIAGGTMTTRGGLTIAAGTQNPSSQNLPVGSTDRVVMQFTLTASSAENISFRGIDLAPTGTANENTQLDRILIYREVGTLGELSSSDVLLSTAANWAANDTEQTFDINPDYTITAGTTETFIVVQEVDAAAAPGLTSITSITSASIDIDALGVLTAQSAAPVGTLTSSTHHLTGEITIEPSPNNPTASRIGASDAGVLMAAIRLDETTNAEDVNLTALTLTPSGTGNDNTGVSKVQFCFDVDADGACTSMTDELIHTTPATFTADNTATVFTVSTPVSLSASGTVDIIATYSFSASITGGQTFVASFAGATALTMTGATSARTLTPRAISSSGFPYPGGTKTVLADISFSAGAEQPASSHSVYPGQTNVVMRQISFTAGAEENIDIEAIRLSPSGTGNDATHISAVRFYLDVGTTPGAVDGTDTLLTSSPTTFPTNNTAQNFSFSATLPNIPAGTTRQLLVVYDIAGGASGPGNSYATGISASSDIAFKGSTSGVSFTSTTDPTFVTDGLLAVDSHPAFLAGTAEVTAYTVPAIALPASSLSNSVAGFTVTAGALENVQLNALSLLSSGSGLTGTTAINLVSIWEDVDGDGVISSAQGDTRLVYTGAGENYGGGTTLYYDLGTPITINAATSKNFLIGYNMGVAPGATNTTFIVSVNPSLVELSGSTSTQNITVSGSTVTGPTNKVGGAVTTVADQGITGNIVVAGAPTQAVQVIRFTLSATENGQLISAKVTPAGSANDVSGITAVKFYLDNTVLGTQGRVDSNDTLLATSSSLYSLDNTAQTFTFSSPVTLPSGTTTDLMIAYDVSSANTVTTTGFQTSIVKPGVDLVINGGSTAVRLIPQDGASRPGMTDVTGAMIGIIPGITIATGGANPATGALFGAISNQAVHQFTLTNGSAGASTVTAIGLTPSGTGNDATAIAAVKIYEDNGNSIFESGIDTQLNTTTTTFMADNTYRQFGLDTTISLAASQTKSFWIVYDMAGPTVGQTFSVTPLGSTNPVTQPAIAWDATASGQSGDWSLGSSTANSRTATGFVNITDGTVVASTPQVSGSVQNLQMLRFVVNPLLENFNTVQFTLTPSGSGNDSSGISQVRACVDTGAKGCSDDAANMCTLSNTTFTGDNVARSFTITGGLGACTGTFTDGSSTNIGIDYNLSGTPVAGQTFTAALTTVSATGASSGLVVLTNSYTVTPATATVVAIPSAAIGTSTPAAATTAWNEQNLVVQQFSVTASSEEALKLRSVLLDPIPTSGTTGIANDATEITTIKMYVDENADGKIDGSDTALTITPTVFAGNDTPTSISINTATSGYTINASTTKNFLIVYALNVTAGSAGDDVNVSIPTANDIELRGLVTSLTYVPSGTFPINGNVQEVRGGLAAALGSNTPAAQSVGSELSASTLQFSLTADSFEDFQLSSVALTPTGTGDDNGELLSVSIYLDEDSDGVVDIASDCFAGGGGVFTSDNTKTTFTMTGAMACRTISAGTSENFVVLMETSSAADAGDSFAVSIAAKTDVVLAGVTSGLANVNPDGTYPITGNNMVVNGTLNVTAAASAPAAAGIDADQADVPLFRFNLAALTENTRVDSVALSDVGVGAAASMNDATALSAVKFYLDEGSTPGVIDSGDTLLTTTPSTFSSDITSVTKQTFTITGGYTVNSGTPQNILVAGSFSGAVSPGQVLRYQILNAATDISAFGLSTSTVVTATGTAITGNTMTVKGKMTLAISPNTPPAQGIRGLSSDQPIVAYTITAGEEDIVLSSIKLKPTGTGSDDPAVVTGVNFYFDSGVAGIVDGETALTINGSNTFPADDTAFQFFFNGAGRTVTANTSKTLLVTYDLTNGVAGSSYQIVMSNSTDLAATGGTSAQAINPTTFVNGNVQTVGGNLAVVDAGTVLAGAVVPGQTNQAVGSFKVSTDTVENMVVNTVRLTPNGTGHDLNDVTAVKFWIDNDQSGTLTPGDVAIAATPTQFTADNTLSEFTFTGGLAIPAGANSSKHILVTYDLDADTLGGSSFALTVPALGIVATGGTSNVPIKTPTAATGANRIATGTFMATLSPFTPAVGSVNLSDSEAEILAIDFTSGPNAGTHLKTISLTPDGTMNDNTRLNAVKFYWDTGTTGIVDGEAQITSTPTVFAADDTFAEFDFTGNSLPTILIPAGQTRRMLVVYDFVDGSPAGETMRLQLTSSASISASEEVSGLAVTPSLGGSVIGNYLTTRNGSTITLGGNNPISSTFRSNATDKGVLQFSITAGPNEAVNLFSIAPTPTGTGDDRTDIAQVKLYRDTGATVGQVDSTDTAVSLNIAKYDGDDTKTTFLVVGTETVAVNTSQNYLLAYDMANTAATASTFRVTLSENADLVLQGGTSGQLFNPTGAPVSGNTHTIRGGLNFALGTNTAIAEGKPNSALDLPVLQIAMTSDGSVGVQIESISLTPASPIGCAATQFEDNSDIDLVQIWEDKNNDGKVDGNDLELVKTPAKFTGDGTATIFTLTTPMQVGAANTKNMLVTYDLAGTALACESYSLSATLSSSVVAKELIGSLTALVSGSAAGNTITVAGQVSATLGTNTPATTAGVRKNQEDAPILQFNLTMDNAEDVTLEKISVTPVGTGDDVTALSSSNATKVKFYLDTGTTVGVVDTTDHRLDTTPTAYSIDNTRRTFTLTSPPTLSKSTTVPVLMVYNMGNGITSTTFGANLAGATDLQIRGVSSSALITTTGNVTGNLLTVTGPATAAIGASNPTERAVNGTSTKVPMLQFTITPGAEENVQLLSFSLTPNGTGNDQTDINKVMVFIDANANGVVDSGEVELAISGSAVFGSDSSTPANGKTLFTLAAPYEIVANTTKTFLVAIDLNPNGLATTGETFSIGVSASTDISLLGTTSQQNIPVTLNPTTGLVGNPVQVGGDMATTLGTNNPISVGIAPGAVNQPLLQLRFQAGTTESVDITSIKLTPVGTADERSQNNTVDGRISQVRFFVDANNSGTVDTGEEEINPTSGTVFTSDITGTTFTFPAGAGRRVTAGQSKTLLVAVNLTEYTNSANVNPLQETIKISLDASTDIVAEGATSGSPITTSGSFTSNALTFAGSLSSSLAASNPVAGVIATQATDHPVLRFSLQAHSESANISSFTITGTGTVNESTVFGVGNIKIYLDEGTTAGALDSGDVLVGSNNTFSGDNGVAVINVNSGALTTFSVNSTPITTSFSTEKNFLVTASLSGTEIANQTVILKLVGANSVIGVGQLTSMTVRAPNTLDLSSNTFTVVGGVTVALGNKTPKTTIGINQTNAPALQMQMTVGAAEDVRINTIQLTPSGTGDDAGHINQVKFYLDKDSDGYVSTGDILLTTTPTKYAIDNTATTFTVTGGVVLSKSTTTNVLVTYVTNTSPTNGLKFRAALANAAALSGTGTLTTQPAAIKGSATGNELTIESSQPTLASNNALVATDGTNIANGIDGDDKVTITFNEPMRTNAITAANINTVLGLNNGHSWLDGNGVLGNAVWNNGQDILEITLASNATNPPTVDVGDTITLDTSFFVDAAGNTLNGNAGVIIGTFDNKYPSLIETGGIVANSLSEIDLTFDEEIDPTTANVPGNYTITDLNVTNATSDTITVTSATLLTGEEKVRLRLSGMTTQPGENFALKINGMKDLEPKTVTTIPTISASFNQPASGLYTRLVVVPPGMTFTSGTAPAGVPTKPIAGVNYAVRVYATDDQYVVITTITNPVQVTISPIAVLSGNNQAAAVNLVNGQGTINLNFDARGAFTLAAIDTASPTIPVIAPAASAYADGATGNISASTSIFGTLQVSQSADITRQFVSIGNQQLVVLEYEKTDTQVAATQIPADGITNTALTMKIFDDTGVPLQDTEVRLVINGIVASREASVEEGTERKASATAVNLAGTNNSTIRTDNLGVATYLLTSTNQGNFTVQAQARNSNGIFANVGSAFSVAFRGGSALSQSAINTTVSGDIFNTNGNLQIISRVADPQGIDTSGVGTFVMTLNGAPISVQANCTPVGTLAVPVLETLCVFTPATPAGGWPVGRNVFQLAYVDVTGQPGQGGGNAQASPQQFELQGQTGFQVSKVINVPNPFNPRGGGTACTMFGTNSVTNTCTDLTFQASEDVTAVNVTIYNSFGRPIKRIAYADNGGELNIGFNKTVQWDGTDDGGSTVARGVYFYELKATSVAGGTSTARGKIAVVK